VDDTPEVVVLSSFDPVRREIARRTLEKLILDGRIQPARIEEIFTKEKEAIEQEIIEAGDKAVRDLGIREMHPDFEALSGTVEIPLVLRPKCIAPLHRGWFYSGYVS